MLRLLPALLLPATLIPAAFAADDPFATRVPPADVARNGESRLAAFNPEVYRPRFENVPDPLVERRAFRMRLSADGSLPVHLSRVDEATGAVIGADGVVLSVVRDGQTLASGSPGDDGRVLLTGLVPGVYSIVARGAGAFAAFSVHLVGPDEEDTPRPGLLDIPSPRVDVLVVSGPNLPAFEMLRQRYMTPTTLFRVPPGVGGGPAVLGDPGATGDVWGAGGPGAVTPNPAPESDPGPLMAPPGLPVRSIADATVAEAEAAGVAADVPGRRASALEPELEEGETVEAPTKEPTLEIDETGRVSGRLLWLAADGVARPLPDARVFLLRRGVVAAQALSDAEGEFEADGLEDGMYAMAVFGEAGLAAVTIDVRTADGEPTAGLLPAEGAAGGVKIRNAVAREGAGVTPVRRRRRQAVVELVPVPAGDAGFAAPRDDRDGILVPPGGFAGGPGGLGGAAAGGGGAGGPGVFGILAGAAIGAGIALAIDDDDDGDDGIPASPAAAPAPAAAPTTP